MIEPELPPSPEIDEAELLAYTLQELGLEFSMLDLLQQDQRSRFDKGLAALKGVAYIVDLENRALLIQTFPEGEEIANYPLAAGGGWFTENEPLHLKNEPWGSALCYLNRESGQIEQIKKVKHESLYGLVISADTSFLYTPDFYHSEFLAETRQSLCSLVHKPSPNHTAYDLYLNEDRSVLCLSDRQAGSLKIFSTYDHTLLGEVQIRQPGSTKALNVTFDFYEPRAFITDNLTPVLYSLNLATLELEEMPVGMHGQIFGNIIRAPDIRYLCLLLLKPGVTLQYLNIESGEFDEEIQLKGHFLSTSQVDPCDLMALSPAHNLLFVMTSHSDPTPLTPGISVIDPDQFQPVHFQSIPHALRDQTKPVALVFPIANPLVHEQKTGLELLIRQGLLTPEKLEELKAQLLAGAMIHAPFEEIEVGLGIGLVPALVPVEAEYLVLDPKKALPAILFVLGQKLYQQTEIDLHAHPEENERFKELAEDYRAQLENFDSVDVLVTEILGDKTLETVLTRQDILSLMSEVSEKTGKLIRPPYTCPACNQPLKGNWDCPSCFFELESPNRAERKKRSSFDSIGALPRFHLLLADPKRRRLIILDDHKTIDWELRSHEMNWEGHEVHFWYALWLNKQNLLVVDKHNSQVFECSPMGHVGWSVNQGLSPEHVLLNPVKASFYTEAYQESKGHLEHFLIVDQGHHRVLVVNRQQQIVWQYGVMGEAGEEAGYLNSPSDLQQTSDGTYLIADTGNHRVIEVREQEIVRSFGRRQGLNSPIFAQRLLDQDTLIVDAGHYRVVEFDLDGEQVRECFYYTHDMPEELRMETPSRVYRREKQSVVLMDEDKVIEIQPRQQKLIWSSLLKHLSRRVEIRRDAFDKRDSYVQSFDQYRLPTLEELFDRLRETNRLQTSSGIAEKIMELFQTLLEARRESDSQRERSAQVKHINDAPLVDVSIYVIDRVNHQIVRMDHAGQDHWHFGTEPSHKLQRPGHIYETANSLLIADTHHNLVLEVSLVGQEVIQIFGEKPGTLFRPRSAFRTLRGTTLVADQGHKRLVEFDRQGEVIWEYHKHREISHPYYAEALGHGTILFVDQGLHMVKEITRAGDLIWSYGQPSRIGTEENQLTSPEFATRLHSGAILIADTGNHRVIEVSPKRKILWEFSSHKKYQLHRPIACQRMSNGNTLIVYNNSRSMLEVNREGEACWYFELGVEPMIHFA